MLLLHFKWVSPTLQFAEGDSGPVFACRGGVHGVECLGQCSNVFVK